MAYTGQAARAVISYARSQVGKPYLWGGTGADAFDWPGLTLVSLRAVRRLARPCGPAVTGPEPDRDQSEAARRDQLDEDRRRRERMFAEHGEPASTDTAAALRLLGLRRQVHPDDAVAFIYRDWAASAAFDAADVGYHGVPRLGTVAVDGGVLGVLDLRPALAADAAAAGRSWEPTDPARPDRSPAARRRALGRDVREPPSATEQRGTAHGLAGPGQDRVVRYSITIRGGSALRSGLPAG